MFPKGAKDLVKFYHLYEEEDIFENFREIDLSNLSHFKNRISTLKRFEVIIKNNMRLLEEVLLSIVSFNQIEGLNLVFSTCDKI